MGVVVPTVLGNNHISLEGLQRVGGVGSSQGTIGRESTRLWWSLFWNR